VLEFRKRTLFALVTPTRQMELTPLDSLPIMRGSIICGKFTQQEAFTGITYPPE
jgi:hypothetical protein